MTDPDPNPKEQPRRVLVIDDSATSRRQIALALEKAGMSVIEASEGVEGLQRARELPFDLVLTDIHMPTMDGLKFIRELRNIAGYRNTPVYVLTADHSQQRLAEGRAAGATAWVIKPPDIPLLIASLLEAVAQRSP